MSTRRRSEGVEVNSDQLEGQLIEIKDRLDGIEALQAHVHRDEIQALILGAVGQSEARKKILILCESPQTISDLQNALGLNSP